MNQEILNLQSLLHPDEPVDVTSDDIKPYLQELGWEEGDKLPSGMQEYTASVLRKLGKAVSMKNLKFFFEDETVRVTLASAINKTKLAVNKQEAIDSKVKQYLPDNVQLSENTDDIIRNVVEEVAEKEVEKEIKEELDSTDVLGLSDVETEKEEPKEEPKEKDPVFCPCCGCNVSEPYVPYPTTEEDELNYVYSIIGGVPFEKTYDIANGLLLITYAVPSVGDRKLVDDQLKLDSINKRVNTVEQHFTRSLRYSLALNLRRVATTYGVDKNPPVPSLHEERFETPGETNLLKFTDYIENEVIKSGTREPFFRNTFSEFLNIQVYLQNKIKDENFMKAVLDRG